MKSMKKHMNKGMERVLARFTAGALSLMLFASPALNFVPVYADEIVDTGSVEVDTSIRSTEGTTAAASAAAENSELKNVMVTMDSGNASLAGYQYIFGMPTTVKDLFDPDYYLLMYPDLAKSVGSDADALYQHYISNGIKEGKSCSPYLNLAGYVEENSDLNDQFGSDYDQYVNQYYTEGIFQGRSDGCSDMDVRLKNAVLDAWKKLYVADPSATDVAARNAGASVYDSAQIAALCGAAGQTDAILTRLSGYAGQVAGSALDAATSPYLSSAMLTRILGAKASAAAASLDLKQIYGQAYLNNLVSKADSAAGVVGYGESSDGASYDDQGNIAVPWDYVENGYITLEMIKARCGDDLFLVQNKEGDVTFLAGNITSSKVTDAASAKAVVESFFGILKFPAEYNLLKLNEIGHDSAGNVIYTFLSVDKKTGAVATTITDIKQNFNFQSSGIYRANIILKADPKGNVISLSATSRASFTTYHYLDRGNDAASSKVVDSRYRKVYTEAQAKDKVKGHYTILKPYEIGNHYSAYKSDYYSYFAIDKKTGEYRIIYINKYDCEVEDYIKIDKDNYIKTQGKGSYGFDYLFLNAEVENVEFTDAYGRKLTLPVAQTKDDKGNTIYYFISKEYKTVLLYFNKEPNVLSEIKTSDLYSFSSLDAMKADKRAITMFANILDARKFFYEVDKATADYVPYLIQYVDVIENNASGGSDVGYQYMTYMKDDSLIFGYDTAPHEASHSMNAYDRFITRTGYLSGASEGYADIIGLALQQAAYLAYINDYAKQNNVSLEEAKVYVAAHWSDGLLEKDWYCSFYDNFKDMNGNTYASWWYQASDPANTLGPNQENYREYATIVGGIKFNAEGSNDNYSCHGNSSILSHVAYQMYAQGIVKTPQDVAKIWYDTIPYLTGESQYYDIRIYVEEIMKERGYSKSDIAKVDKIFVDANITAEAMEKYPVAVVEDNRPENNMDSTFGTYDPSKQTAYNNEHDDVNFDIDVPSELFEAAKANTDTEARMASEAVAAVQEEVEGNEALAAETGAAETQSVADAEAGASAESVSDVETGAAETQSIADAETEAAASSGTEAAQVATAAEAEGALEAGGADADAASDQTEDPVQDYDSPAETDTADYAAAYESPEEYDDAAADDTVEVPEKQQQ